MKFEIKNHKVCLIIFIFISVICVFSGFSVYSSKSGEAESKIDLALKEDKKSGNSDSLNTSDKSEKKSFDDLLKDISEDISEDSLKILLNTTGSVEIKEEYLNCVLDDIIKKKEELENFKKKIELCSKILKEEKTFVTIKNIKNLIAVGDLHGDSVSTAKYVKGIEELFKKDELDHAIFLGDYVDRGLDSIKVLDTIIDLKLSYPNKVTLLRGNHETRCIFKLFCFMDENSLINQISWKYYPLCSKYTNKLNETLLEFFDALPLAADIDIDSPSLKKTRKILAVHGGIPCEELSDLASNELMWESFMKLRKTFRRPPVEILNEPYILGTQILWNDFDCKGETDKNIFNSDRSSGRVISKAALKKFCKIYSYDFIIRGHTFYGNESIYNLFNRCYTIFSASNYVGSGNKGSIAYFDYYRISKAY
ncbi:MAG: metallophosphoesterase [Clostridia bacterium]|nr:metallophosphoesterase [Clostridia bacterium]